MFNHRKEMLMEKKKIVCLYRVSTKTQATQIIKVGDPINEYDIPMQKQACRGFIDRNNEWELYKELSEFGVSGYKVSAKNRDAIQEIQSGDTGSDHRYHHRNAHAASIPMIWL
jgi:hypothetical protein